MKRPRDAGATRACAAPAGAAAAELAIVALSYLAADPEQLSRFIALTGIDPGAIRAAAQEPGFLAGVLDHVCGDERLLVAFAAHAGITPGDVAAARHALGGGPWERDVP